MKSLVSQIGNKKNFRLISFIWLSSVVKCFGDFLFVYTSSEQIWRLQTFFLLLERDRETTDHRDRSVESNPGDDQLGYTCVQDDSDPGSLVLKFDREESYLIRPEFLQFQWIDQSPSWLWVLRFEYKNWSNITKMFSLYKSPFKWVSFFKTQDCFTLLWYHLFYIENGDHSNGRLFLIFVQVVISVSSHHSRYPPPRYTVPVHCPP